MCANHPWNITTTIRCISITDEAGILHNGGRNSIAYFLLVHK
jgi:hypothetical protein